MSVGRGIHPLYLATGPYYPRTYLVVAVYLGISIYVYIYIYIYIHIHSKYGLPEGTTDWRPGRKTRGCGACSRMMEMQ
jgi:hypothetical protein